MVFLQLAASVKFKWGWLAVALVGGSGVGLQTAVRRPGGQSVLPLPSRAGTRIAGRGVHLHDLG